MAEYTSSAEQTVTQNGNVLFTDVVIPGKKCIVHRTGSGLFTLRGITNNRCNAHFLVTYSGNIAIPTGGNVQEISLAISINGEPISSSYMRVVPAAVNDYFNVSKTLDILVPAGCCLTMSIENTSGQSILAESSDLIIQRIA